ncbi:uncharacterized protein WCC33_003646 [Rhinophrynus dorsalis]
MEENFLFLSSLGTYTSMPERMVKSESMEDLRGRGQEVNHERQILENTNSGNSDSSPIIVKIEPDDEEYSWGPELNGEREMPPSISTVSQPQSDCEMTPSQLEEALQSQQQAERERQRKVRFSEEENDVLINSIMPHYDKLFGRLAARTSTAVKNALWREIASSVNAISAYPRSLQNCKKRYADVKRKVKDKLCKIAKHRRATGGRAPLNISFWPYERVMEKIISADIVAGVPGATDSGRLTDLGVAGLCDPDLGTEYPPENNDDSDTVRADLEEPQIVTYNLDQDEPAPLHTDVPETEDETSIVQEETSRESRQKAFSRPSFQEQTYSARQQSLRDHTTLIYAEQSHFRRTMAKKLDILNNNVKVLNKSVKAFQSSFTQSISDLSHTMRQQNAIFEKLSANLLMIAQQQQQHNQLCMSGVQQILQGLPSARDSPLLSMHSKSPSEASPIVTMDGASPPDVQEKKGARTHEEMVTEVGRPSTPSVEAPKRRRH